MIDGLNDLEPHMLDALTQRVAQGDEALTATAMERAGLSAGAVTRGFAAYRRLDLPALEGPACTFAQIHAWGEADGLRRAALALSDHRARGREREVIEALRRGAEIEDAIRGAQRSAEPIEPGANVVPLRR